VVSVNENEEIWHQLFVEGNAVLDKGRAFFSKIPGESRCMFCHSPFDGPGARLMSMIGRGQSSQQPHVCMACVKHGDKYPGGAHVEIATVFADMRGSTPTAERIGDRAFTDLINRFYRTSSKVLVDGGALLGRLAGDQAIGYFVPGMAGPDYAQAALDSAVELLRATGHHGKDDPWIPLGVGVHTGNAYVGLLGEPGGSKEMTALGDDVNVGARLADEAETGEILASLQLAKAIGLETAGLEHRDLQLKGKAKPLEVAVVKPE
jgi:adenylate cyclase